LSGKRLKIKEKRIQDKEGITSGDWGLGYIFIVTFQRPKFGMEVVFDM